MASMAFVLFERAFWQLGQVRLDLPVSADFSSRKLTAVSVFSDRSWGCSGSLDGHVGFCFALLRPLWWVSGVSPGTQKLGSSFFAALRSSWSVFFALLRSSEAMRF